MSDVYEGRQVNMRAEVKSGHISHKGYKDSPVIILCPDYPIIPSLFCIQMAHIQHHQCRGNSDYNY